LARDFWALVGEEEPFPRKLRGPIRAVPLTVQELPYLTVASALQWLERNGISPAPGIQDRALRGCLVARHGHAVLFLDALDPEDEQCFTIAHELAHYLRDYRRPRQLAIQRLGTKALEVLDGKRPPTTQERLAALFTGVPLGFHVHLMDRDHQRRPVDSRSADAEARADHLAWELLAPAGHVATHEADHSAKKRKQLLEKRLCRFYGLPAVQARRYACALLGGVARVEPWLAALRNSLQP
jgi:hypothetical protein